MSHDERIVVCFSRRPVATGATRSSRHGPRAAGRPSAHGRRLTFECFEPRRALTILPSITPPAEEMPACELPVTTADQVVSITDAEWNSLDAGPGASGVSGTLDPGAEETPGRPGDDGNAATPQDPSEARGSPTETPSVVVPDKGAAPASGGRPRGDMIFAGAALEIERSEWTAATTVRYSLQGRSSSAGGAAETGSRRGALSLAFIDVGSLLGGSTASLRAGPIPSRPPSSALGDKAVTELNSGILDDFYDSALRSDLAPARVMTPARPSLWAATRSQGMMLLDSAVPLAAEPRRPGPTAAPVEAAPEEVTPEEVAATTLAWARLAVPSDAIAGRNESVTLWPVEDNEAGVSVPAPAPETDDRVLRHAMAGIALLTILTSAPTSTASDGIPCHGADGPRIERFQGGPEPTRKIRP